MATAHAGSIQMIDRTAQPRPLVITQDTDMSNVALIDNNLTRPAIILLKGSLKLGSAVRSATGTQTRLNDPGVGNIFNGNFLPQLGITFSHHDFDRAFVAAMGTFKFECKTMVADTCMSITANPDGTYGQYSTVKVGSMSGFRFGVLASGQKDLSVAIDNSLSWLWGNNEGPGHTFYANISYLVSTGEFLRLKGVKLRIGRSQSVSKSTRVRSDQVTAKFKGSWGVDYVCLSDQNACGAVDQYGSSGNALVFWTHPGGDAMNGLFTAFRSGEGGGFGVPPAKFMLSGAFDCRRAQDWNVPSFRWESKLAGFGTARVVGGGVPSIYPGTDLTGLTMGDTKALGG